jgi:hypothetical protein
MATEIQAQPAKERVATYLYFSSVYAVTVGVLYLWGYWSTFGVNILEYLSLADIVKTAAYPVASVFAIMGLGRVNTTGARAVFAATLRRWRSPQNGSLASSIACPSSAATSA